MSVEIAEYPRTPKGMYQCPNCYMLSYIGQACGKPDAYGYSATICPHCLVCVESDEWRDYEDFDETKADWYRDQ